MTIRTKDEVNVSRRSALKKLSGISGIAIVGLSSIPNAVSAEPGGDYKFKSEDSASYANGNLVTGFHRHYTESSDGIGAWRIPLEVNSNACTQGNGANYEVNDSDIEVDWNKTSTHTVFTRTGRNKYYTGASTPRYNPDRNDYWPILEPIVNYSRGRLLNKVPYGKELMTVGQTISNTIDVFAGGSGGDDHDYVNKHYSWVNGLNDVGYWSNYLVDGGRGEAHTIQVDSYSNKGFIDSIELHTNTPVLCSYPNYSPSSISKMTTRQKEKRGIISISSSEIKQNPAKFGMEPNRAEKTDGNPVHFVPPSKEEIKANKNTF